MASQGRCRCGREQDSTSSRASWREVENHHLASADAPLADPQQPDHVCQDATSPFLRPDNPLISLSRVGHICSIRNPCNRDLRWLSIWADSCGPFGRVTSCRNAAGFEFDPESKKHHVSMWKGHYTKCQLPYTRVTGGLMSLRHQRRTAPLFFCRASSTN